jgi:hypothetical protein
MLNVNAVRESGTSQYHSVEIANLRWVEKQDENVPVARNVRASAMQDCDEGW